MVRARKNRKGAAELVGDEAGQATVEYVLLLVAFGLPMVYVFGMLLGLMSEYYGMVTFLETLPFP